MQWVPPLSYTSNTKTIFALNLVVTHSLNFFIVTKTISDCHYFCKWKFLLSILQVAVSFGTMQTTLIAIMQVPTSFFSVKKVTVSVAIIQLEVSGTLMQVKISAAYMSVTNVIEIMQVGVSVAIMQVVFSIVPYAHDYFYCDCAGGRFYCSHVCDSFK